MTKTDIISKMNEYILVKENEVIECEIKITNISFINVRDRLLGTGKILEENFDHTYYIASIRSGFANQNYAIVFIKWDNDCLYLLAYAKEGFIHQHSAENAIEKVIKKIVQ